MKKSALLAVSALSLGVVGLATSLGVVGLATFTPVVSAAGTTATGTATIAANVSQELAIGGEPINAGQDNPVNAFNTFGATFSLDANAEDLTSQNGKEVSIKNNSGHDGALTVSSQKPDMTLTEGGSDTIPAKASVGAGTSAWAIKSANSGSQATSWTAVTTGTLTLGTDTGSGLTKYIVDYAASTDETQVAGDYSTTITYTYTIQDLTN